MLFGEILTFYFVISGTSLGSLHTLKRVTIRSCDGFSPAGLEAVCGLSLLERLELEWVPRNAVRGFGKKLRKAACLQHLSLVGCQVSPHFVTMYIFVSLRAWGLRGLGMGGERGGGRVT